MGRHRKEYPTGKLRLKHGKEYVKDKAYTLYYEYCYMSEPVRKDTGIRVKVSDWNPNGNGKRGELRASFGANYTTSNNLLKDTLNKYDELLRQYVAKHPHQMSKEIIQSILFDKPLTRKDEANDFVEYTKSVLKSKLSNRKIGKSRYENGISGMKVFTEFLASQGKGTYQSDAIYLGDITRELVEDYIQYRREIKKNSDATINHALTPIIAACERAKDEELIDGSLYVQVKECRIVEKASLNNERFTGKFLSKAELIKMVEFYNSDVEPRRKEYIEMFLFAFHAGGMRLVDVMTLKWEHISMEKKELRKTQIKTVKGRFPRNTVPLNKGALAILQKWQERARRQRFVFDLVPDDFNIDDEEKLYYVRNSCDKKVNQALQIVGEKIGLSFNLGFHTARHTFAINALNDGMALSVVSRLLGHATTDTTETVYADYLPHKLSVEMDKLNYVFLPNLDEE